MGQRALLTSPNGRPPKTKVTNRRGGAQTIEFNEKRILLLGFGGEARASLNYLRRSFKPKCIGVADQAPSLSLHGDEANQIDEFHYGDRWLEKIATYDIVIRSPGIPLHAIAHARSENPHIVFTSGTSLFLEEHRHRVWGITGTKGKSTTSTLLYTCLKATGVEAILCGNIGIPALSLIDKSPAVFVMELSSYQLEDCPVSPRGALFLNLFSEHLDHHGTKEAYLTAKLQICKNQLPEDTLILAADDEYLQKKTASYCAQKKLFGSKTGNAWIENDRYFVRKRSGEIIDICGLSETKLKGPGNRQNILAVLTALTDFEFDDTKVSEAIRTFAPLAHRLEEVGTFNEITFINDSISTVPEATINALATFGDSVKTLILGGYDRGVSFVGLAKYLSSCKVEVIILFPPSGVRIREAIEAECPGRFLFFRSDNMAEAVAIAFSHTPRQSTCLLSPASPSFPIFKNFEERGKLFRETACNFKF